MERGSGRLLKGWKRLMKTTGKYDPLRIYSNLLVESQALSVVTKWKL
jgi:hypothetical protein